MKKAQRSSFKLNPVAAAIAIAMTSQFVAGAAHAGSGYGSGMDITGMPMTVPTYYANSPVGPVPAIDPVTGTTTIIPKTGRPVMADSGKALRKFVDTLPGIGAAKANNLGQYLPVAVPEKWVDLNGVATNDDYYEIAAIEYTEKMHSDLPKATHLRGYVQLSTAKNPGLHIALTYPNGSPILDANGVQVYAYDKPHHLGPIINATKGTAVRIKFTNYLPVGGELFLPVDTTITGAGVGPDGVTKYTQNRAQIHLSGGDAPWISAGSPHQWVAPAGEAAAYAAGMGKGASAQNVPDMADPGPGSNTLYFPNDVSARFMFYQDRTSGLTRLNSYAGLEAGYFVTDAAEQALIANGTIPADQIPLIIEDKTFVPQNIAQQDAKWDTAFWGQPGDLWYPHVYEPNQDPNSINASNPVGRWDYGPLFWPVFPATQPMPSGVHGDAAFVPDALFDTPLVNGTAYPTLTVDPKAYRFRILNASNDRTLNLSLFKADTTMLAPQLDKNGNPIVDATGVQQYFTNTEVKMVPAMPDAAGNPPGWDAVNGVQLPLRQYPKLQPVNTVESSGPSRAWPIDARPGGTPDPTMAGPDFIAIGNDGGLLPNPVDIPAQPVTYEANRRSITIGNVYCYGLYMGPAERADTIVDFSAYAGQTLILYNDAPAPNPWHDERNDYYTGNQDLTASGGTYTTLPGYGPNTRTIMQIKVNPAPAGTVPTPFNADALVTALPAAYSAAQPMPIVPASAYNNAFGTNNTDIYAHVATGSLAQPTLDITTNGALTLTGVQLVSSGGPGTGSGTGYLTAPLVNIVGGGGTGATAVATINTTTQQVSSVTLTNPGTGYTSAPTITFTPTAVSGKVAGISVTNAGSGYTAPTVSISGGGGTGATATANVATSAATIAVVGGSGYTAPTVTVSGGGVTGVTGSATVSNSPATIAVVGGSGYTAPTVTVSGGGVTGVTGSATVGTSAATIAVVGGSGYTAPTVTVSGGGVTGVTGSATVGTSAATVTVVGGSGYTAPTVTVSGGGVTGVTGTATVDVNGVITGITLTPNSGFTSAPTIAISDATGTGASATATVDPTAGTITGITLTPNAGFTSAPTIAISDATGTGASATATVDPIAGTITGVTLTPNAGFTTAPTIAISDATGTGASATATVDPTAGVITGVTLTPNAGFTSAPTITISDATGTGASATATVSANAGAITGVTLTNTGTGFNSAPTIVITDSTGTGATAVATISGTSGTGAQAQILTSNTQQLPVFTKAEQELFDNAGRYNFTGGVEVPFTNAVNQTTVPLSYYDSPTDIIGDNEVQIWKIVDNGFWTNSMHFDMVEVQVVNRVGWDGTVKPPSGNELGWKDTLRLNQLEDLIVAMRAKRPTIPFGLPKSSRAQDPTMALGGKASGLNFMADPAVVDQAGKPLLTTTVNVTADYDNEFVWNSANLSHSENDFIRPLVYHPTVVKPAAPTNLADATGSGTMTWVDTTPAAAPTTIANPQNEIGFKVLKASVDANGNAGVFTQVATVPANVTSWTEPAPTPNVAYEVVAYNAAGDSDPSLSYVAMAPVAPTALTANPVVYNSVTLSWGAAQTATKLEVWRNGVLIATLAGNATGFVDDAASAALYKYAPAVSALMTYNYEIKAVNALGSASATLTVTTPMQFVAAPTGLTATPNAGGTQVALRWTDAANNETAYWVEVSTNGGATYAAPVVINRTAAQKTATGGIVANNAVTVPGSVYTFRVTAVNVTGAATSTSVPVTVVADLSAPLVPAAPTNLVGTLASATRVTLTWLDNANNENSYLVTITNNTTGAVTTAAVNRTAAQSLSTGTNVTYNAAVVAGNNYSFTVVARATRFGLTTVSAAAGPVTVDVSAPAAPTTVAATPGAVGSRAITITWVDAPLNARNYTVQRATVTGGVVGAFGNIATVNPGIQTFTDVNRVIGRTYVYQVRANGAVGNSAFVQSNQVVAQ